MFKSLSPLVVAAVLAAAAPASAATVFDTASVSFTEIGLNLVVNQGAADARAINWSYGGFSYQNTGFVFDRAGGGTLKGHGASGGHTYRSSVSNPGGAHFEGGATAGEAYDLSLTGAIGAIDYRLIEQVIGQQTTTSPITFIGSSVDLSVAWTPGGFSAFVDMPGFADTPAPNLVAVLAPGATAYLNEQVLTDGPDGRSLTVTAFRIHYDNWLYQGTRFDGDLIVGRAVLALSDPRTQTPGVPEPGAWALMLAGFGLAGSGLREARRRRAVG